MSLLPGDLVTTKHVFAELEPHSMTGLPTFCEGDKLILPGSMCIVLCSVASAGLNRFIPFILSHVGLTCFIDLELNRGSYTLECS